MSQTLPPGFPDRNAVVAWILDDLVSRLKLERHRIDTGVPLNQYGLDSMQAVMMSGDIGEWIGVEVPPNALYEHPTVDRLARYILSLATPGTPCESGRAVPEQFTEVR